MSKLQQYIDENLNKIVFEDTSVKKDVLVELGEKIRNVRLSRKISQSTLSAKTGISQANLSLVEKGKLNVTIKQLDKICDGLDATLKIEVIV